MGKSTFTPGPWVAGVSKINGRECFTVCQVENTSKVVASCGFVGADDESESIANVTLISATKVMLEALKECVTESGSTCFHGNPDWMKQRLDYISGIARNAIFQASGK